MNVHPTTFDDDDEIFGGPLITVRAVLEAVMNVSEFVDTIALTSRGDVEAGERAHEMLRDALDGDILPLEAQLRLIDSRAKG
jgi:hypothetical protein